MDVEAIFGCIYPWVISKSWKAAKHITFDIYLSTELWHIAPMLFRLKGFYTFDSLCGQPYLEPGHKWADLCLLNCQVEVELLFLAFCLPSMYLDNFHTIHKEQNSVSVKIWAWKQELIYLQSWKHYNPLWRCYWKCRLKSRHSELFILHR